MREFLYITSSSYSGSTLLAFLLNAHPKIACIGEIKGDNMDAENYCCSCGAPIGRCAFWGKLIEGIRAQGLPFDVTDVYTQAGYRIPNAPLTNKIVRHRHRGPVLEALRDIYMALSPACRRHMPRIHRTNQVMADRVAELTGSPIFVDASKDPIRIKYLRRSGCFHVKVIYMVRDGRGVMNSIMKHTKAPPEFAAREWLMGQREIEDSLRGMPESDIFRMKYEDLCVDPKGMMERIFRFCGVDPAEANPNYREVEHHILGNQMRLGGSSEIRLDTKWTRELTPEQVAVFERMAGDVNRSYGYQGMPASPAPLAVKA